MLRRALRRAKGIRVAINKFWKVHLITRNSLLIPTPQAIEAHTVGGGWVPKKLYLCYYVKLQQVMTLHPCGRAHTGAIRWCLALNTLTASTIKWQRYSPFPAGMSPSFVVCEADNTAMNAVKAFALKHVYCLDHQYGAGGLGRGL